MSPTKKKPSGAWFEKKRKERAKNNIKSSIVLSSWTNQKYDVDNKINTEQKKDDAPVTNIESTIIDDRYNLTEDNTQNNDNNEPTTSQVNNELTINFNDPDC